MKKRELLGAHSLVIGGCMAILFYCSAILSSSSALQRTLQRTSTRIPTSVGPTVGKTFPIRPLSRQLSTIKSLTGTPFQKPPLLPERPTTPQIEGESLSSFMKRQAAADKPWLALEEEHKRGVRLYLSQAWDAVNYAKDAERNEKYAQQETDPETKAKLIKNAQEGIEKAKQIAELVVSDAAKQEKFRLALDQAVQSQIEHYEKEKTILDTKQAVELKALENKQTALETNPTESRTALHAKHMEEQKLLGLEIAALEELNKKTKEDLLFANAGREVVLEHFKTEAAKGNKMAIDLVKHLEEITKKIATEPQKAPDATSWEDQYLLWIRELEEELEAFPTRDKTLYKELLAQEIAQALQDKDVAISIELNAQKQTNVAKILLDAAAKNPGNVDLVKVADIAKNNAFAAQYKYRTLIKQLSILPLNERASYVFSNLRIGKKALAAQKAAQEQAKIAEKAAQEKAERDAKAKEAEQKRLASQQQQAAPAAPAQETWAGWFRKILGRAPSKEAVAQTLQTPV